MKIAYLINAYPRPSQSFIRREMAALEAAGVRVERFAIRAGETPVDEVDRKEARRTRYVLGSGAGRLIWLTLLTLLTRPLAVAQTIRLVWKVGKRSDRGVLFHLIYLVEACVLAQWFARDEIQHVHSHFGTNSTTVAMLCNSLGGPSYSFTAHGPEEFDKPDALALREKVNNAAFVVAVCEFGKSQLFRWCRHEQWHKVHVIRCGVDDSFLAPIESTVPVAPELLSVGRLAEQKGQLLLIEAASMLAGRGFEFHLTIVGDGEMREEIEKLIEERRLGDRITLAGWKSNSAIKQMMLDSRALVMPSFAEGLPVVLMESLALKRPVISTYIAGIPELVETGVCGHLVPAGDVPALADAMVRVLSATPEQLEQLGIAGRQRVLKRHDASIEAGRLAVLFRRALQIESSSLEAAPLKDDLVLRTTAN